MIQYDVVIVGAGHAGTQAAIALCHNKFAGSIAMLGDEFELPYEGPPLSKDYLAGIHTIRRRTDVDRISAELNQVETAVIIGGGYIGLEAAAVLIKQGKKVVVLESQDRVLARVAGEPLSRFYEAEHRTQGVDIRLGAMLEIILGSNGVVSGIQMANGETIRCQMVIMGIAIEPAVKELLAAGALGGNGIAVDEYCRSSLSDAFAIGDCALHANPFADGINIRLESVQNASDQAKAVAATITGKETTYNAVPWFWSNQYDLRLQTVGLSIGYDQLVMRGDTEARSFSLIYLRNGRVIALDCVNATKDYVQGRKLVEQCVNPNLQDLANPAIPLKALQTTSENMAMNS